MYGYEWTDQNGIYRLSVNSKIQKEIRPVFKEELDYFGFNEHWSYPDTKAPLLWAEGIRRYVLNGVCVAEAVGGGFYTKPTIKIYEDGLALEPIDVDALWKENERLMLGLEKTAMDFIRSTHEKYEKEGMAFAVAFSGGKDSLALLDLVARTLSPDKFSVVFSNTGMELSTTLQSVEKAKQHWASLKFYEAKSHLDPEDSWEEFGPPGRRMRWCCAVHKSVPTILLLREITGNYNVKAVVFDGVRAEESAQRASYDELAFGEKNINQINCHPILKWGSSELFLYLLKHEILFNQAYRDGLFRVGCAVCPMSSAWWDGIANDLYKKELNPLLSKVESMAAIAKPASEVEKYVEQGGWKARMGGNILPNGGKRVIESTTDDDAITFAFTEKHQEWLSVAPLLGPIVYYKDGVGSQIIGHQEYRFRIKEDRATTVSYYPASKMDRFVTSYLRSVANKVAYCIGCKACCVQCPTGAFNINDEGKIYIRSEQCVHCYHCLTFTSRGCLVAKSLASTGGTAMELKGMDRYKHFGLRRPWLENFFQFGVDYFTMGRIGTKQYEGLGAWLYEANLITVKKAGVVTPLFEKLKPIGGGNPLTWAIIWTNLAYNSIIVKWYMLNAPAGEVYEKNDLIFLLGDDYSKSTRDNAVTALLETFRHSPIGTVLKQGIPIPSGNSFKFSKQGWNTPDAVAILYALYMWAEATGRYTFTLSQMAAARGNADAKGVDPVSIFGINPDRFKDILQDIALQFDKYIRTTFVADLDNVQLFPEYKSIDILDLIAK
ncbi:MAG: phosphoadenosine phosphosulfate reductase family protein [Acidaminococcaceae bacterium]|nr:phosphoadenosine phosphosulfate reductase family protein [Acidaminococcaceae bacterium]